MTASTEGLIKLNDAARDTQKIDPSEVQNPLTRKALDKWNRLRGERRFPSRRDAQPRELSSLLRNIALVRVVQGGADFEFRVLGDAIIQSQTGLQTGMTTNELKIAIPVTASCSAISIVWSATRANRMPIAASTNATPTSVPSTMNC